MPVSSFKRHALTLLCVPVLALGVAACGSATVSTSSFSGEDRNVAQAISNLQSHATDGEERKICAEDLSSTVVKRLGGAKQCEAAIKNQLTEVDSFELSVGSVQVTGTTASAVVKSIDAGKTRLTTLTLVKEGSKWKTSGLG
jgi:hypothetical protein